jgi:outer membrane murein-binding lipoprotein Lpp
VIWIKKLVIGLTVVLMVLVSGCVSLSYDAKVNRTGGIEKYNMTIDTNSYVYSALNSKTLEEDGKSIRDSVTSKGGKYKEVWDGNNVKILISGLPSKNASVEKNENYIIYKDPVGVFGSSGMDKDKEDSSGVNKAMDQAIKIHYYLEMPNKIIDSNADYIEGNKAEWHMLNLTSIKDVYAKCETPSILPEMGLLNTVFILLIMTLIVKRNYKK